MYGFLYPGNDLLHQLTSSKTYDLRIDLEEFDGTRWYAVYANCVVGSEADGYSLNLGNYQGDAGKYDS